jgi:hypothetical protein
MPRIPPELASALSKAEGPTDPMAWLGQVRNISDIDKVSDGEWTTLYEFQSNDEGSRCFYSALVPPSKIAKALKHDSWEVTIGGGGPGFVQYYPSGKEVTKYERHGLDGEELIVYVRDFHGVKPRQFDFNQEFVLYHNLYHDRVNDIYIRIDDRGRESLAIEANGNKVRVKTLLLRQFMAARQMALAIYFDHRAEAPIDPKVAESAIPRKHVVASDRCYDFYVGDLSGRAFSRLIGKRIIAPPPVEQSGVWPFSDRASQRHADFIIDVDGNGSPTLHNCNPDALANYFGANESAPHYLTPVWFSKTVLAKYYDEPNKYSVEDGYLRCGSLWGIRIDNDLPNHVVVYLGDLGRDLDYEEQVYWQHYNVTPGDRRPSETNFRRSFLAQFTNPTEPDLVFKQEYQRLNVDWQENFGYPLYRPLHDGDAHILKQLRVPISDSGGEFDTQVLYLVKLLVDSLNEKELVTALGGALPDEKGISKFERYLAARAYPYKDRDIGLLRTLQDLRSAGAAHAKGSRFDKLRTSLGLEEATARDVFRSLLVRVNELLAGMSAYFMAPREQIVECSDSDTVHEE